MFGLKGVGQVNVEFWVKYNVPTDRFWRTFDMLPFILVSRYAEKLRSKLFLSGLKS